GTGQGTVSRQPIPGHHVRPSSSLQSKTKNLSELFLLLLRPWVVGIAAFSHGSPKPAPHANSANANHAVVSSAAPLGPHCTMRVNHLFANLDAGPLGTSC